MGIYGGHFFKMFCAKLTKIKGVSIFLSIPHCPMDNIPAYSIFFLFLFFCSCCFLFIYLSIFFFFFFFFFFFLSLLLLFFLRSYSTVFIEQGFACNSVE